MVEPIYDSAEVYVTSKTTLLGKIAALDAIIDALMVSALQAAARGNVQSYYLNDGQTQIRSDYRSVQDVETSINAFTRLKNMYVNQYNGRVVRMVDGKNFTGKRW